MPTPPLPTSPFYGRERELSRVRLLITQRAGAQIGFYGIGGLGKSTLLDQIAHAARDLNVTPYIVRIDLDARMGVTEFLTKLLDDLRATGATTRRMFGIFPVDTLAPFEQKLKRWKQQEIFPTTQQHIQAHDASTVHHVTTQVLPGPNAMKDMVTLRDLRECLGQLFYKELPVLVTVPPGVRDYLPRRLLILLVDTIEQAQPEVLDLLYELRSGALNERCILICAGRSEPPRPEHTSPLLSQELDLLDAATVHLWATRAGIHDVALRTALVNLCAGLPLLVRVAITTVQRAAEAGQPIQPQDLAAPPPVAGSEHALKVLTQLLDRYTRDLEQGDPRKRQMSLLLRYGCIPRNLKDYDLIRALQIDGLERDLEPTIRALQDQGMLRDAAFHPLLRKAALVRFYQQEPVTWAGMVERAKDYYQRQALLDAYLALLLLVGDPQAGAVFSATVTEALRQQDLALAQRLIAVVAELDTPQHLAWELRLARADLALAQGDPSATQEHLVALLAATPADPQRLAELTTRLARLEERAELNNLQLLAWWLPRQPDSPAILARLLELSAAFQEAYQYATGAALAQQALAMATRMNDQPGCAHALRELGEARYWQFDMLGAEQHYREALAISQEIADHKGAAHALRGLGDARYVQADAPGAERHYRDALEIYREIGDRQGAAHALIGLGDARRLQADAPGVERHYRDALKIYEEIGDRQGAANALRGLGQARLLQGDTPGAERHFQQALAIYQQIQNRWGEANALYSLGDARLAMRDAPGAAQHFQQALEIYQEIANRLGYAYALRGLGDARLMQGDAPGAERHYQQALAIFHEIQDRLGAAYALRGLGQAHWALGNAAKAIDLLEQARSLARQIGYLAVQFQAVTTLINIAEEQDNHDGARGYQVEYQRLLMERRR